MNYLVNISTDPKAEIGHAWAPIMAETLQEAADNKPVPCGYKVAMGICSIPGKSGRQPYDCANCKTGTDQNIKAVSMAEGKG
jgi:hypothetical protein